MLSSAAKYGMRPAPVSNLLRDAGLIGALPLPEHEQIHPVDGVERILDAASASISMVAAMECLGLSRDQIGSLIKADILSPSQGGDNARPRFTRVDIERFLSRHGSFPPLESTEDVGVCIGILATARRHGVSTAEVYAKILDGTLTRVYRADDNLLWSSLRIDRAQADRLFMAKVDDGSLINIGAAGIRMAMDTSFLRALAQEGWFNLQDTINPRTNQAITRVEEEGIASYEARFITRRMLTRHTQSRVVDVQIRLETAGVFPVRVSEGGKEAVFDLGAIRYVLEDQAQEIANSHLVDQPPRKDQACFAHVVKILVKQPTTWTSGRLRSAVRDF